MSELIFGPSAEWLPLSGLESLQPRLDGGYNFPIIKKISNFVVKQIVVTNQPTLFDELDELENHIDEDPEQTLF